MKFLFLPLLLLLAACSESPEEQFDNDNAFPEAVPLSKTKHSAFQATLESPLDRSKNSIYAASLLYCWDEIKHELHGISGIESDELQRMHDSRSYQNVLRKDEYISSIERNGNGLTAKAYFKKVLPFLEPFDECAMQFGDKWVKGFGFSGADERARLVYYENDSSFAVSLLPVDREHEIILLLADFSADKTLKSAIDNMARAEKRKRFESDKRKTRLMPRDVTRIPNLAFNIETHYKTIEGTGFKVAGEQHRIDICWQRTAFIINKNGAKAESKAIITEVGAVMPVEEKKVYVPKKLIFSRPYIILLKRKNARYPYFAMYVADGEWMD